MDWLERLKATEPGDERNTLVAELAEKSIVLNHFRHMCFAFGIQGASYFFEDAAQDVLVALMTWRQEEFSRFSDFYTLLRYLGLQCAKTYRKEFQNARWLGKHIVLNDCQKQLQQSLGDEDQIEIGVDTLDADVPCKRGELALPKMLWMGLLMVEGRHGGGVTIRELPGKRYHRTPCNEHLEFAKVGGGFKLSKRAEFGQFGHSKKSCWLFGLALFDTNDKANDKVPEMVLPFETTPRLYTNKALILKPQKIVFSGDRVQTPYDDTYQF